mmetsp:Transcript_30038/g.85702  ORF Transcript_30038/g.85702 Transcript_30038/m.85702 type:complete len:328 (-) Transcript_30038:87-1070(-)
MMQPMAAGSAAFLAGAPASPQVAPSTAAQTALASLVAQTPAAPMSQVSASATFAMAVGVGAAACFANSRRRSARAGRRTQPESRVTRLAYPLGGAANLRLMLDTSDLKEWEKFLPLGFFHGITSNPVLMQRAGWPVSLETVKTLYAKAFTYPGIQEILFQTWGDDAKAMYERALEIRAIDPVRIGVKIPLTTEGMKAARMLRQDDEEAGTHTNICMTACYSAGQGFAAQGLDATYISPYLGRMNDQGMDGIKEISELYHTCGGREGRTQVLVASLRNAAQMVELARAGLDAFTFSPKVAEELVNLTRTNEAAAWFERAGKESRGEAV